MKNGEKNKSLYSLHAKLLLNLENLNLKDLRILLIESSLFRIDEKDMVSILFTPESGRSLLKLATNVEQTSSSRLGNYSLINNSQVRTKGNSIYIFNIGATLSTVGTTPSDVIEPSLTFKFGSKHCLKLKNECKWGFANGSLALVDLRLQIINSTEVITDILGIRVENEETLLKQGREDPNYNNLVLKFKAKYLNKKTEEITPTVMSEPKVEKKVKKTSQEVETESWKGLPLQLRNVIVFRTLIALRRSEKNLNRLHALVCPKSSKIDTCDLKIILLFSYLFTFDYKENARIAFRPEVGLDLLRLASNAFIPPSTLQNPAKCHSINKNQITFEEESVYIYKIGASLYMNKDCVTLQFGGRMAPQIKLNVSSAELSRKRSLMTRPECFADIKLELKSSNVIASVLTIYLKDKVVLIASVLTIYLKDKVVLLEEGFQDQTYLSSISSKLAENLLTKKEADAIKASVQEAAESVAAKLEAAVLPLEATKTEEAALEDDCLRFYQWVASRSSEDQDNLTPLSCDNIDDEDIAPMVSSSDTPITTISKYEDEDDGNNFMTSNSYTPKITASNGNNTDIDDKICPMVSDVYTPIITIPANDDPIDELNDWIFNHMNFCRVSPFKKIFSEIPSHLRIKLTRTKIKQITQERLQIQKTKEKIEKGNMMVYRIQAYLLNKNGKDTLKNVIKFLNRDNPLVPIGLTGLNRVIANNTDMFRKDDISIQLISIQQ
ncbi:uncharacterized protein LOC111701685 isoform X3 [Eurytemora carolleeae]|nr:uncharacterized protein LOC111701685 isoform X3 [Eurytemora carolleeae]|eukprot:XP_023328853.1 uncharacterized protein LOC111701685 isoform X3 [Eurytemora affinis]